MIIGFGRSVLVLPEEAYRPEELVFILKHELVHLKRGDVYVKLLLMASKAVNWFNPIIWMMQKEAVADMELSCDERVVQDTNFSVRKAYTETLFSTLAYIRVFDGENMSFDAVEWVEVPGERAEELGITEDEWGAAGFYIYNEDTALSELPLARDCVCKILDWSISEDHITVSAEGDH